MKLLISILKALLLLALIGFLILSGTEERKKRRTVVEAPLSPSKEYTFKDINVSNEKDVSVSIILEIHSDFAKESSLRKFSFFKKIQLGYKIPVNLQIIDSKGNLLVSGVRNIRWNEPEKCFLWYTRNCRIPGEELLDSSITKSGGWILLKKRLAIFEPQDGKYTFKVQVQKDLEFGAEARDINFIVQDQVIEYPLSFILGLSLIIPLVFVLMEITGEKFPNSKSKKSNA